MVACQEPCNHADSACTQLLTRGWPTLVAVLSKSSTSCPNLSTDASRSSLHSSSRVHSGSGVSPRGASAGGGLLKCFNFKQLLVTKKRLEAV